MSLADDLDLHLIGDEDDLQPPQLGDIEHVDRLLRGIAWRRKKMAEARALVDTRRAEQDEWLAEQEKRYDTSFHEDVLAQYHRARLPDDPKAARKSVRWGKGGSVRLDIGGRRIIKKKKKQP